MSMFLCAHCDQMRDSDDGCADIGNMRRISVLVCVDCADRHAEEMEAREAAAGRHFAKYERRNNHA